MRGASVAGVLKALGAILAFGLTVVLGRVLGVEATGVYFLALTTATIAATIGRVGLDSAVTRLVAAHASDDKWSNVYRVYRKTLAIGLVCSSLVAAALYFAADFFADTVFSDSMLATPIRVMAVAVVPLSLSVLISQALLGLSRIRDSVLVFSILPTGVTLGGMWILATKWGVNGAIVAYVIAVTAALVYGWIAWRRTLAKRSSAHQFRRVPSPTRELLRSGMPLLIGALLQLVLQLSGLFMLGIWADNIDVSQYAVAWRTAMLISFVLLAVSTIAQPKFAELYAGGDLASLGATANKATLLMVACAAPVFLVFVAEPIFVMRIFGSGFSSGATILQILSVGQFFNVVTGSYGVLLVMSGLEREYRNAQLIAASVVLSLNIVLIPTYGATGAAIAAASAITVRNTLFGYFVWTKLGILVVNPRSLIQRSVGDA
jgi:O-antigen/teichoic acid export membrane protein